MMSHTVAMAMVMVAVAAGARMAAVQTAPAQAAGQSGGGAKPGVNPRAEAVNAFSKRVASYLDVRKKAESGLPPLKETDDPSHISAREQALGDSVRKLRPTAKAGDIFGTDMSPLIVEILRDDWEKRTTEDRAAIIAEMPKPFVPKINMRYPVGQPLLTFPPNLLKVLHQLPEDLEYRFVGRDLILRDVKANIIVDVIRNARPPVRS